MEGISILKWLQVGLVLIWVIGDMGMAWGEGEGATPVMVKGLQVEDSVLFPALKKDADGRTLFMRHIRRMEGCGQKAVIALVGKMWYWRHIETGTVVPLPRFQIPPLNGGPGYSITCSPDGMEIFTINMLQLEPFVIHRGTILFRIKDNSIHLVSNASLLLEWSPDGRKVAVYWPGYGSDEPAPAKGANQFDRMWVKFPDDFGYQSILVNFSAEKNTWVGAIKGLRWQSECCLVGTFASSRYWEPNPVSDQKGMPGMLRIEQGFHEGSVTELTLPDDGVHSNTRDTLVVHSAENLLLALRSERMIPPPGGWNHSLVAFEVFDKNYDWKISTYGLYSHQLDAQGVGQWREVWRSPEPAARLLAHGRDLWLLMRNPMFNMGSINPYIVRVQKLDPETWKVVCEFEDSYYEFMQVNGNLFYYELDAQGWRSPFSVWLDPNPCMNHQGKR
ncbi:MAG: hypothetical protein HQL85_19525 [Magnetococcales bacterium]|nr:hypothetical protein [Magnetococcales bacterium]MBF0172254.1 hypothetical protein [Magnetococcales bacterium]MBF0629974.1 hypothetical protein [Magnetococcales bacterium]